jgi:hypothetical protein
MRYSVNRDCTAYIAQSTTRAKSDAVAQNRRWRSKSALELKNLRGSWKACTGAGKPARELESLHGSWKACTGAGKPARELSTAIFSLDEQFTRRVLCLTCVVGLISPV